MAKTVLADSTIHPLGNFSGYRRPIIVDGRGNRVFKSGWARLSLATLALWELVLLVIIVDCYHSLEEISKGHQSYPSAKQIESGQQALMVAMVASAVVWTILFFMVRWVAGGFRRRA